MYCKASFSFSSLSNLLIPLSLPSSPPFFFLSVLLFPAPFIPLLLPFLPPLSPPIYLPPMYLCLSFSLLSSYISLPLPHPRSPSLSMYLPLSPCLLLKVLAFSPLSPPMSHLKSFPVPFLFIFLFLSPFSFLFSHFFPHYLPYHSHIVFSSLLAPFFYVINVLYFFQIGRRNKALIDSFS